MKLVNLLLDEPSQIISITFNLLKIILTLIVPFELFNISEVWNVDLTNPFDLQISTVEIVIGLFVICFTWFIIWELLEFVFYFFLRKFGKAKDFSTRLNLADIQDIFKLFKLFSQTEGGYIKPSTKSTEIAAIVSSLEDDFSMRNTFFLDFVLVCVISWTYLIFKVDYSVSATIGFTISAIILIILTIALFVIEKILTELRKNQLEIKNQLESLVFKSTIHHVIINHFYGLLNQEESNLMLNFRGNAYDIFDDFSLLKEIGEIRLKNQIEKSPLAEDSIVIVNYEISDSYKKDLEKEGIYIISGTNEEELIVNISKFINKLAR